MESFSAYARAGNRIPAPMALAISMLGIGDVRHAASTLATAEGRNVPAQGFFRFQGGDWMFPNCRAAQRAAP
jgi:hypothetical protein